MSEARPPQAGLVSSSSRHAATRAAELVRRGLDLLEMVERRHEEPAEVQHLRQAATRGDAEAQHHLGDLYYNGEGVPQDYTEAFQWIRRAAEQGDAAAQNHLGGLHANGHGVPQDYAQAMQWYQRAAEQGYADAQYALGRMYQRGRGVPQDYAEAVQWFRRAAEQLRVKPP